MFIEAIIAGIGSLTISSFIIWRRSRQKLHDEESVFDLIILVLLGGIVASRATFILFHFDAFGFSILRWLLFIPYPGLSLMGGILGGLAIGWYRAKKTSLPFWELLDSFVLAFSAAAIYTYLVHFCYLLVFTSAVQDIQSDSIQQALSSSLASTAYVVAFFVLLVLTLVTLLKKWLASKSGYTGIAGILLVSIAVFLIDFISQTRVYYEWISGEQVLAVSVFITGLTLGIIRSRTRSKKTMLSATKKLWKNTYARLSSDEKKATKALADLKKEDPFSDPDHAQDNAASDTDAFEQSSHQRVESLRRMLRNRLRSIRGAKKTIEEGQYGKCELCKKAISSERLKVMPVATICVECEKKQEKIV